MKRFRGGPRWLRLLSGLLGLSMIATACGGGDDTSGGGDNTGRGGDETTTAKAEAEGVPASGGTITYGLEAETENFCLTEAALATSGVQVTMSLYDSLTAPNAEGEIKPYLAKSVESNDDYTVWTITVREGITFHDGSELTAEVVQNNLQAYRGEYEARAAPFQIQWSDVASVEVVAPLTVEITMKRPWTAFPWFLWNFGRFGIMAQAQLDSPNCGSEIIGTGPFMLESPNDWVLNQQMELTRNPNYWQTDANGTQLPYLDKLIYKPIPETAARINALEAGQIHMLQTEDAQQIDRRLRPLVERGALEMLATDKNTEVRHLFLNVAQPPFNNKNARLAVAHGLDRELLNEVQGGGIAKVASGPFPPGVPGYLEDSGFPEFDPDKAREAAAAYESETGQQLRFNVSNDASQSNQLFAQEIQGQLAEVGIDMSIDVASDQASNISRVISGDFQATDWRNHGGADPDTNYFWWYEGSALNFSGIADQTVNRLLDEGHVMPPGPERVQIYEELNRRLSEEVYNVWISWVVWAVAHQPQVRGLEETQLPDGNGNGLYSLATGHLMHGIYVNTQS